VEFGFESVNGCSSLALVILSGFFAGLGSAVFSIVLQTLRICIFHSKAGYVSMDSVELLVYP